MFYKSGLTVDNLCTLRKYGDKYKLVFHNNCMQGGIEKARRPKYIKEKDSYLNYLNDETSLRMYLSEEEYNEVLQRGIIDENFNYEHEEELLNIKLAHSLSRTRSKIFEYSICNDFEWFCTYTANKVYCNRYDLKDYHKRFAQDIRNFNNRKGGQIKYLLIPEQHKDGAWHEHGLMKGIPVRSLTRLTVDMKLPKRLLDKIKNGSELYSWNEYADKFGFCTLEKIKSKEACSKYITKYISKDLNRTVTELNAHMYYCSQGLNKAELIKKELMLADINSITWDYSNEYVSIKWIDNLEDALKYFNKKIPLVSKRKLELRKVEINKLINNLNNIISQKNENVKE